MQMPYMIAMLRTLLSQSVRFQSQLAFTVRTASRHTVSASEFPAVGNRRVIENFTATTIKLIDSWVI
jgi:hypothetical protein